MAYFNDKEILFSPQIHLMDMDEETLQEEYNKGHSAGFNEGKEKGYGEGYDVGESKGYDSGHKDGYEEGHKQGHNEGYDKGYDTGYDEGRDAGYESGVNKGYEEQKSIMFGLLGRDFEVIEKEYLDGMTYVGAYAFYNYTKLKTVRLPESVTYLKGAAFQGCTALTLVELPETLVDITANGFMGCTSLTSLTIPASVKNLLSNSLRIGNADNKATVFMKGLTPPTVSSNTFNKDFLDKIMVKPDAYNTYLSATNRSYYGDKIDASMICYKAYEDALNFADTPFHEISVDYDIPPNAHYLVFDVDFGDNYDQDDMCQLGDMTIEGNYVDIGGDLDQGRTIRNLYNDFPKEVVDTFSSGTAACIFNLTGEMDCRITISFAEEVEME